MSDVELMIEEPECADEGEGLYDGPTNAQLKRLQERIRELGVAQACAIETPASPDASFFLEPSEPTRATPGSRLKLEVLAERAKHQLPLWHEDDWVPDNFQILPQFDDQSSDDEEDEEPFEEDDDLTALTSESDVQSLRVTASASPANLERERILLLERKLCQLNNALTSRAPESTDAPSLVQDSTALLDLREQMAAKMQKLRDEGVIK